MLLYIIIIIGNSQVNTGKDSDVLYREVIGLSKDMRSAVDQPKYMLKYRCVVVWLNSLQENYEPLTTFFLRFVL